MAETRGRGQACTIYFPLIDFGATDFESTPVLHAAGDTQYSEDGAAFQNTAAAFAHEGNGIYSLDLAAGEMGGAHIVVTIIDQGAKAWEDQAVLIDTGNAYPDGFVWVDAAGTASIVWPHGTANHPVDTIARGLTIATANRLHKFRLHGALTLVAGMEHYCFHGVDHIDVTDLIDINGQSIEHSVFHHLIVTGAGGNAVGVGNQTRYTECLLYAHTNIHGTLRSGSMGGACGLLDGGIGIFTDTFFGEGAACVFTLQAPAQCDIINMRGAITLAGMDGGVCNISQQNGADITINNTCTAGTITITGWGTVTDNSGAGCTVNIIRAPAPNRIG